MGKKKENLLTVRFTREQLNEFLVACESEGGTMSSVTRTFVFKKIRDAKERNPEGFASALAAIPEPKVKRRRVAVVEAKDEKKQQRADAVRKNGRRRAGGRRKSG